MTMLCQDLDCGLAHKEKAEWVESKKTLDVTERKDIYSGTSSFKVEIVVLV